METGEEVGETFEVDLEETVDALVADEEDIQEMLVTAFFCCCLTLFILCCYGRVRTREVIYLKSDIKYSADFFNFNTGVKKLNCFWLLS